MIEYRSITPDSRTHVLYSNVIGFRIVFYNSSVGLQDSSILLGLNQIYLVSLEAVLTLRDGGCQTISQQEVERKEAVLTIFHSKMSG